MTIDLHFQSSNIVKYRTDVTFGWLDLMVAFGGIAGLFLGCSLLSGVEIIYYILVMTLIMLRKCKRNFSRIAYVNSQEYQTHGIQNNVNNRKNLRKKIDNVQVHTIRVISFDDINGNSKESEKSKNNSKKTRY